MTGKEVSLMEMLDAREFLCVEETLVQSFSKLHGGGWEQERNF